MWAGCHGLVPSGFDVAEHRKLFNPLVAIGDNGIPPDTCRKGSYGGPNSATLCRAYRRSREPAAG